MCPKLKCNCKPSYETSRSIPLRILRSQPVSVWGLWLDMSTFWKVTMSLILLSMLNSKIDLQSLTITLLHIDRIIMGWTVAFKCTVISESLACELVISITEKSKQHTKHVEVVVLYYVFSIEDYNNIIDVVGTTLNPWPSMVNVIYTTIAWDANQATRRAKTALTLKSKEAEVVMNFPLFGGLPLSRPSNIHTLVHA